MIISFAMCTKTFRKGAEKVNSITSGEDLGVGGEEEEEKQMKFNLACSPATNLKQYREGKPKRKEKQRGKCGKTALHKSFKNLWGPLKSRLDCKTRLQGATFLSHYIMCVWAFLIELAEPPAVYLSGKNERKAPGLGKGRHKVGALASRETKVEPS